MQKGTNELTPPKFEIDTKHDGWANISCSKYGYFRYLKYVNKNQKVTINCCDLGCMSQDYAKHLRRVEANITSYEKVGRTNCG